MASHPNWKFNIIKLTVSCWLSLFSVNKRRTNLDEGGLLSTFMEEMKSHGVIERDAEGATKSEDGDKKED